MLARVVFAMRKGSQSIGLSGGIYHPRDPDHDESKLLEDFQTATPCHGEIGRPPDSHSPRAMQSDTPYMIAVLGRITAFDKVPDYDLTVLGARPI